MLKKVLFSGISVVLIFISVLLDGETIVQAQPTNCPQIIEHDGYDQLQSPFYYFKTYSNDYIELFYADSKGRHETGLRIDYPEDTNTFRTSLSPFDDKLALIFLSVVGDPSKLMPDAFLYLIQLNTFMVEKDFRLTFNENFFSSSTYFSSWWERFDLSWGWQNPSAIVFNMPEQQVTLQLQSGDIQATDWSSAPWEDSSNAIRIPILETGLFDLWGRPSSVDGFYEVVAVDRQSGEVVRDDIVARYSNMSYRQNIIIFQNTGGFLRIIDLTEETTFEVSRRGWYEYSLNGVFYTNKNLSLIAFHTANKLSSDDRPYIIELELKPGEDYINSTLIPLCYTGLFVYNSGTPSWSDFNQYQFAMRTEDSTTTWFVYDFATHSLIKLFEVTLEDDFKFYTVGWGEA